jgi:radical SAM superfamily enzyme YgiQ (UPF0313 family)
MDWDGTMKDLYQKGIREIWLGVESGDPELRHRYGKLPFENEEVVQITETGRKVGINVCWFLVDGPDDTGATRLKTYDLMRKADPFRCHIGPLARTPDAESASAG